MSETQESGMRILRVEVRNFGTWNGGPHVFETNGSGAVIAGENGAGKSTIMDALITLFPMTGGMRFNGAAAKGGKTTRDIRDYYRGAYGNSEDEERGTGKVTTLRDVNDDTQTMAVLMVFGNDRGDVFSVARTLYIHNSDLRWRHITGPVNITIANDLAGWPSGRELSARASRRGFTVHDSQEHYWSAIALGLGLQDADLAKRAFKTMMAAMAAPDFKSVTELIREHVLPPFDIIAEGEEYFSILESNGEIQRRIRETRRKVDDLSEIVGVLDVFEEAQVRVSQYDDDERRLSMIEIYAGLVKERERLRVAKVREAKAVRSRDALTQERAALLEARRAIQEARQAGGTEAIGDLRRDLARTESLVDDKEATLTRLSEKAAILGISNGTGSAEAWERMASAAQKAGKTAQADAETLEAEVRTNHETLTALRSEISEKTRRLEVMKSGKTKVDDKLVAMRNQVASKIGLLPEDMPFIAELIQVRADEVNEWEFALNKLLRGQAQRILVHHDHFRNAKRTLHQVQGIGRIVIEQVLPGDLGLFTGDAVGRTRPDAAARKLDVRNDSPFGRYVDKFLARNADHICVSEEGIGDTSVRALTPSGVILSSSDRVEKDSGKHTNILGWSVEEAIASLETELAAAQTRLAKVQEVRTQAEHGRRRLQEKISAAAALAEVSGSWARLNTQEDKTRLSEIRARLSVLETKESENGLADRAAKIEADLARVEEGIESQKAEIVRSQNIASSAKKAVSDQQGKISRFRQDTPVAMTRADYAKNRERAMTHAWADGWTGTSIRFPEHIDILNIFDLARREVRAERNAFSKKVKDTKVLTQNLLEAYFRHYGDEAGGPPRNPTDDGIYAHERREAWRAWHRRIRDQDLRDAEEKMRAVSRSGLTQALSDLKLRIINYQDYIRKLVAGINESMSQNVYTPSTNSTASIMLSSASDPYHADFDAILTKAVDNAATKSEAEFYEDAAAVADYVRDGDKEVNRIRRDKLRNLSNRYVATVRERVTRDGVLKTVRTIDETGKLSGGERERLNFFLLSAALKTAFESKTRPELSLRTFLVDEAFSKSSDESAAAAIEVIRSFGHQIIIATPMSKILPFEGVAERVFLVSRPTGTNSVAQTIYMKTLAEEARRDA